MPDILDSITAIHSREERYAKLELLYRSEEEREKIMKAIEELRRPKESNIEISDTKEREGYGIISIEFHDDYDKESGPYFDALIERLGIDRCL
ncbi:hypothetical protein [Hydrogenimonas sp.]